MNLVPVDCIISFRDKKKIVIVDANVNYNQIKKYIDGNFAIVVPQVFCFDYPISLLGRVTTSIAELVINLLRRYGVREESVNQIKGMINNRLERTKKYIRELRSYSARNNILLCNVPLESAIKTVDKLRVYLENSELEKLTSEHDHYYVCLWLLLKETKANTVFISNDKKLKKAIEIVKAKNIRLENTIKFDYIEHMDDTPK